MEPQFFSKQSDFRKWLKNNHDQVDELWVGYYKKATGLASVTWPETVDEALCYGWIDGIRKSIDEKSYKIRFTPRRAKSHWSAVNLKRVPELKKMGLMDDAGLKAYAKRDKTQIALSKEREKITKLSPAFEKALRKNKQAWAFFDELAPSYKKNTSRWVMSAKKEETRLRRLSVLIESSEQKLLIPHLRAWDKKK